MGEGKQLYRVERTCLMVDELCNLCRAEVTRSFLLPSVLSICASGYVGLVCCFALIQSLSSSTNQAYLGQREVQEATCHFSDLVSS